MKVIHYSDEVLFDEFFEVRKGVLQFEKFDGSFSPTVTRYSFSKWDAVAILVYHREEEAYLLVRQMRYPPVHQQMDPWITEIVAGGISPGEDEREAAFREVIEEVGYRPITFERIMQFYVSPGIMSERIALYYAEVDESSRVSNGGGLLHEDEDIEVIRLPRKEVNAWMADQPIGDAKTILALQWHQLQQS